ncbi:hypothetical protein [Streptomyces halstedii]|uniref:hypothetical protein n=1 Tax=Streptomyces halstedii TaxID=1944 RepID=UPI00380A8D5E
MLIRKIQDFVERQLSLFTAEWIPAPTERAFTLAAERRTGTGTRTGAGPDTGAGADPGCGCAPASVSRGRSVPDG